MDYCLAEPKCLLVPVGALQQTAADSALVFLSYCFAFSIQTQKLCKSITVVPMVLY